MPSSTFSTQNTMADDTREQSLSAPGADKAFAGKQWEDAQPVYKAPENANLMAGGTEHTAGGKVGDVTLVDAAKSITREDWSKFHRKPCVKDSLLTGIGAGAAMGGARAIWKSTTWHEHILAQH